MTRHSRRSAAPQQRTLPIGRPPRAPRRVRCAECGSFLVNVPGQPVATCPQAHGRLQPRVSKLTSAKGAASPPLPVACRVELFAAAPEPAWRNRVVWIIDGRPGLWRKKSIRRRGLQRGDWAAGSVLAQDGDRVVELHPWAAATELLRAAGFTLPEAPCPST